MKTEAEIRMKGMQALISALGPVEAERLLVAVSRDRFDYTEPSESQAWSAFAASPR